MDEHYEPELAGWLLLLGLVVAWDVWAIKGNNDHVTLTRSAHRALERSPSGEVVVGLLAALVHHILYRPRLGRRDGQ